MPADVIDTTRTISVSESWSLRLGDRFEDGGSVQAMTPDELIDRAGGEANVLRRVAGT